MGEGRAVYRVLVGKPEGKRPVERPRHRWEDNINLDFQAVDVGVWTGFSWLRTGTGGGHLSLSSYISHGVGPLVDLFRSHVSRSLFKGLP
jgi:hypothetical protein